MAITGKIGQKAEVSQRTMAESSPLDWITTGRWRPDYFAPSPMRPSVLRTCTLNTLPNGSAEQFVVGNPEQRTSSTSGEARLTGRFGTGAWRHDVVFLARGRDTLALYGGSDVVDVGPAFIDQGIQVPEPSFTYTARTQDRTELWSAGVAYRAQWQGHGDFAFGVQQESYDKNVSPRVCLLARRTDHPLRAYGNAALALGDRVTAYAGYTQGLEDSGAVPSVAANRGTILPDARTWQTDAGFRFLLTSKLKLIAGVFEIEKPYFNFDTNNVDRQLGIQRARGVELSLSGEVVPNLNVAVGALLGEVKIIGSNLAAEGVGTTAFGQPHARGRSTPITSSRGDRRSPLISPFKSLVPRPQVLMMSHKITQQRCSPWVAVTGSNCGVHRQRCACRSRMRPISISGITATAQDSPNGRRAPISAI